MIWGRVVIPIEIRRTMRIREGEPMEIFTGREGEIILKKYSPIGELGAFAREYAQSLSQVSGHLVCISDHDQIIAASGPDQREYLGKNHQPGTGAGDYRAGKASARAEMKRSLFPPPRMTVWTPRAR